MHSVIQPNDWVALKLPNGTFRVLQVVPNTYVHSKSIRANEVSSQGTLADQCAGLYLLGDTSISPATS
jgi:hypothetical protein